MTPDNDRDSSSEPDPDRELTLTARDLLAEQPDVAPDNEEQVLFDLRTDRWLSFEEAKQVVGGQIPSEPVASLLEKSAWEPADELTVVDLPTETELSWEEVRNRTACRESRATTEEMQNTGRTTGGPTDTTNTNEMKPELRKHTLENNEEISEAELEDQILTDVDLRNYMLDTHGDIWVAASGQIQSTNKIPLPQPLERMGIVFPGRGACWYFDRETGTLLLCETGSSTDTDKMDRFARLGYQSVTDQRMITVPDELPNHLDKSEELQIRFESGESAYFLASANDILERRCRVVPPEDVEQVLYPDDGVVTDCVGNATRSIKLGEQYRKNLKKGRSSDRGDDL